MGSKAEHCMVITTCADRTEAQRLASALVDARLAACVQMAGIESVYRWQGKVVTDEEIGLYIKTRLGNFPAIERLIKEHHSYTVPEIIALPLAAGSADYLGWIDDSVGG